MTGLPAYSRRFRRTFGYYQGRAAVAGQDGWRHILADGSDLYDRDHVWCGNYQGDRCAVRDGDGLYTHLGLDGRQAYQERWRYAGDYRDGLAVVQREDGRSTHIDLDGRTVHGNWFLDLDVFHKGSARARDEAGWTHVDRTGTPIHRRRFAMVEPFYNGQARVEGFDGSLQVIDEGGSTVLELRPPRRSEFAQLSADMVGFWKTQTIRAAVELGVIDACPGDTAAIAAQCRLAPRQAPRLLQGLGELGLLECPAGVWRTTQRGDYLRSDHPMSLASAALEYGGPLGSRWSGLAEAMREGGGWTPTDIFAEVARNPERIPCHHTMLRSYARHDYPPVPPALGLRGDETVIDAGGGLGVLTELMLREYPALRVVLLDRPEVTSLVTLPGELAGRADIRAGDVFAPWDMRGDAVVLARVLHDWGDDAACRILSNARACLKPGDRVFIIEMVMSAESCSGSLCDLHLAMATGGGCERTAEHYAALLATAGFIPKEVIRVSSLLTMIVGVVQAGLTQRLEPMLLQQR